MKQNEYKPVLEKISLDNSYIPGTHFSVYQMVFPIVKLDNKGNPTSIIGSCFPICKNIFASAAHIYDSFEAYYSESKKPDILRKPIKLDLENSRYGILKLQVENGCFTGYKLLPIFKSAIFLNHDVSLLLTEKTGSESNTPIIPPIKEFLDLESVITVTGYAKGFNTFEDGKLNLVLVKGRGTIVKLHPERRDLGACWYPCIELDAPMAAGHSGGPAFDLHHGAVVGINSRSLEYDTNSIISWIGKFLDVEWSFEGMSIKTTTEEIPLKNITIRILAQKGLLQII